jgi:hypothetical protein
MFRPGMNNEVTNLEDSCGFGCFEDFLKRSIALLGIQRRDINVIGKRRVERVSLQPKCVYPFGRAADGVEIVIIKVRRKGADFDHAEPAVADGFQAIKDALPVKRAG